MHKFALHGKLGHLYMTTLSRCELCFLRLTKVVLFHRFRLFTVPKSLQHDFCCKYIAFERGRNVSVITNFLLNHDMRAAAVASSVHLVWFAYAGCL